MRKKNEQFLHRNWLRSADRRHHLDLVEKAKREGRKKPAIKPEIRAKYTVSYDDLCHPMPETFEKLVPVERNGEVVRDVRGQVKFKKEKPRMSHDGCHSFIKSLHPDCPNRA